jgi:hypothetical protein
MQARSDGREIFYCMCSLSRFMTYFLPKLRELLAPMVPAHDEMEEQKQRLDCVFWGGGGGHQF